MSTYVVLDSEFRKDVDEPTTNYHITSEQTFDWPDQPRIVNAVAQDLYKQPLDFHSVVEVQDLLIYFDAVLPEPFLKLSFYNLEHNDHFFINSLDDNRESKFFLVLHKNLVDNWYRYRCATKQLMRMKRKGAFVFKIWDKDNNVLNVGTGGRTVCSLSITPYLLDGSYDNHLNQARRI